MTVDSGCVFCRKHIGRLRRQRKHDYWPAIETLFALIALYEENRRGCLVWSLLFTSLVTSHLRCYPPCGSHNHVLARSAYTVGNIRLPLGRCGAHINRATYLVRDDWWVHQKLLERCAKLTKTLKHFHSELCHGNAFRINEGNHKWS